MYIPFEQLSDHSRLWIFQSNRKFTPEEIAIIRHELQLFTQRWSAHGHPLQTSFDIRYDQFILLAVNEDHHGASGCSVDESVRVMKELMLKLECDFFDRTKIAFLLDDKVVLIPQSALKASYHEGLWNESSRMFNNVITSTGDLQQRWIMPAGDTWLKRYVVTEKMST
jgi:hypothetical protein